MPQMILGAALGTCVHVGGLHHFLKLAEAEGYRTFSLGPAVPIDRLIEGIRTHRPDLVAISYRLTPENASELFNELRLRLTERGLSEGRFVFGGTPPVAEVARAAGLFERAFSGMEPVEEIKA
ncbi:MAG: cobalamin-dependent protein, partial [Bacteroidota bacterium]